MSFNNIEEHNPEEILKIIEEATLENYSNYEIENAFTIALKKYEEQGKKVESENISKEIKPFGWEYLFSQKNFNPLLSSRIRISYITRKEFKVDVIIILKQNIVIYYGIIQKK